MHKLLVMGTALFTATAIIQAGAKTPKNALGAIAVSPDGKTVVAAGDNRVMYIVRAGDLAVQKRIWIKSNPLSVFYSKDGTTVIIHDTRERLSFYDTKTWKIKKQVMNIYSVAQAEKANVLVTSGQVRQNQTPLHSYNMTTGNPLFETTVNMAISMLGVSSDASKIIGVSSRHKTDAEEKQKPPKELKGLERKTYQQKHDQQASTIGLFDRHGNETKRFTTWFSDYNLEAVLPGNNAIMAVGYSNQNLQLNPADGSAKLFETENSYNYGSGYSLDAHILATGGLADGTLTNLADGTMVKFRLDRKKDKLPGWPEYFKNFSVAKDGTVYGGTTAYRLVKIGADGKILKIMPIF